MDDQLDDLPADLFDEPAEPYDQDGPGLFDDFDPDDEPGLLDEKPIASSLAADVPSEPISQNDDASPTLKPELSDGAGHPEQSTPVPQPSSDPVPDRQDAPVSPPVSDVPHAPLALYRRYRPDTFADVIGQDHVTGPLQRALINNKVNHAYLFSGPRGCGKTSSARILARCLNCEQGPTPTPCGVCQSCRDLATGGAGSIDVIEMDAASHGGVNEARDLRERAFFAPVQSRYKIYIIDEAHMVTKEGFNALLKLVEEPPSHVKFIFATTEPEKVIGTIRSRTHHYPFRLVPPKTLAAYLEKICAEEGVSIDKGVLPLAVRAGAGSVRDSLSVLDQLLGAAGEQGVAYDVAAGLLGYTPDSLLDDIVDAFVAGDAKGVFATIDRIIEVGQDPRRFAEDLLQRFRDLVIVAQVDGALSSGLVDVSADQGERLERQAGSIGAGELTRAAEVIAKGLVDMRGTTAPRLHLELMCSRVLLPGADVDGRGIHARLDRLERRLSMTGDPVPESAGTPDPPRPSQRPSPSVAETPPARQRPAGREPVPESEDLTESVHPPAQRRPAQRRPAKPQPVEPPPPSAAVPATGASVTVLDLRRLWPNVLEAVKERRRFTWMMLSQNATVAEVADGVLTLEFSNPGARESFSSGGSDDVLRKVLIDVVGADLRIVGVLANERLQSSSPAPADEDPSTAVESREGVSADDEIFDEDDDTVELLKRQLGAQIIEED